MNFLKTGTKLTRTHDPIRPTRRDKRPLFGSKERGYDLWGFSGGGLLVSTDGVPLASSLRIPATRRASPLDAWRASPLDASRAFAAIYEILVSAWPPRARLHVAQSQQYDTVVHEMCQLLTNIS